METGEGVETEAQQLSPTQEPRLSLEKAMVEAHFVQRQAERERRDASERLTKEHGQEVRNVIDQWEELPKELKMDLEKSWLSGYSDSLDKMRVEQPEKYQKIMDIEDADIDIERQVGKTARDRIYADVDGKFIKKTSPLVHRNLTVDEAVELAVSNHMAFTHHVDVSELRSRVGQRMKDLYDIVLMEMEEEEETSKGENGSRTQQESGPVQRRSHSEKPGGKDSIVGREVVENDKNLVLQKDILAKLQRIVELNERRRVEEAYYIYVDKSGKQQMGKFEAVGASSAVFLSVKSMDNFLQRAREIETEGGEIVGFFHNHPRIPSELESAGHNPTNGIAPNQGDLGSERFRNRLSREGYGGIPMIIGGVVNGKTEMFAYRQIREIGEDERLPYLEAGQKSVRGGIVFGKSQYADLEGLRTVTPPVIEELDIVSK